MNSLILCIICFASYFLAYKIYGKYLGQKIFRLDPNRACPSKVLQDDIDYVPAKCSVLFGHHFTSIAGLGPIIGPAIGIIWGWLPAVLWVLFGSIFLGAVHDFAALVISMRNDGHSLGDIAGKLISERVRNLFLAIFFLGLWVVISVFALVVGILFHLYPSSVLPVWLQIPIAITLGYQVYHKQKNSVFWGIIATILMYISAFLGSYFPIKMPFLLGMNPIVIWTLIMFIYAYIASTLPVTILLQPRDYINAFQLWVALFLIFLGIVIAQPPLIAPAVNLKPIGAPSIWPFLFVIIACGAISGFHSLVSSGTTSKQCDSEKNAYFIGYGSMLLESALSLLVIVAVAGGIGLGLKTKTGQMLFGAEAFQYHYSSWGSAAGLAAKLEAFVVGSVNLLTSYGIPAQFAFTLLGVFLISFAGTTLDSATRIQRYVVGELGKAYKIKFLTKIHPATIFVVFLSFILAFHRGFSLEQVKKGALSLWPLFGTINQLLAVAAFLVIIVYLLRNHQSIKTMLIPISFMIVVTIWAMISNLKTFQLESNWMLFTVGIIILILEIWIIFETIYSIIIKSYRHVHDV